MPKILCIVSLAVSALIFLVFLLDLIAKVPFGGAGGLVGHLGMMFGTAVVGTFCFLTIRECR